MEIIFSTKPKKGLDFGQNLETKLFLERFRNY